MKSVVCGKYHAWPTWQYRVQVMHRLWSCGSWCLGLIVVRTGIGRRSKCPVSENHTRSPCSLDPPCQRASGADPARGEIRVARMGALSPSTFPTVGNAVEFLLFFLSGLFFCPLPSGKIQHLGAAALCRFGGSNTPWTQGPPRYSAQNNITCLGHKDRPILSS